jgi:GR25 family glycosyltransferase involved in LPS biosynthesis
MNIVIHAGYYRERWSASDLESIGFGGTEKSIINLSRYLGGMGNKVFVTGDVANSIDFLKVNQKTIYINRDNSLDVKREPRKVNYVNFDKISEVIPKEIDLLIGVSYLHYIKYYENYNVKKSVFWMHNTDYYPYYKGGSLPNTDDILRGDKVDTIVCLTPWHKQLIANSIEGIENKIIVIPNMVDTKEFLEVNEKIKHSFIYTSHAERGLWKVLNDWPNIREVWPDATLHISTPVYGLDYFEKYFLHEILKYEGVFFYGCLAQKDLYKLMAKCQIWYYPTDYEETFCITAWEMLGHSVAPVTSLKAGLTYTIGERNINSWQEADKINFIEKMKKEPIDIKMEDIGKLWEIKHLSNEEVKEINQKMAQEKSELEHVYIITMDAENPDKSKKISEEYMSFGLVVPFTIFHAVDGRSPNVDFSWQLFQGWKMRSDNKYWNREITAGEIGCALSHLSVWKDAFKKGYKKILILEEDFKVLRPWSEEDVKTEEEWGLFYLGRNRVGEDQEEINENIVRPGYSYCTHAYMLSRMGIQRLLEQNFENTIMPVDEFLPATYIEHPRADLSYIWRDTIALALKNDMIGQTSTSETSLTENLTNDFVVKSADSFDLDKWKSDRLYPELFDTSDWEAWKKKNLHESAITKEWDLIVDEPIDNVYTFPLFTKQFCEKVIREAEHCAKWQRKRHQFYPTTDMLLTEFGFDEIYHRILVEYVYPMSIHKWHLEGKVWEDLASENFIIKYDASVQGHLSLHHDSGSISCVLALNDDFVGGGTYFEKQKVLHNGKVGHISVHPSVITHRHGGRPVEEGQRFIIVSFCNKRF